MFFRFGSKSGEAVPSAQQALQQIQSQLQQQQQLWAEQLAQDPARFAALEEEVHLRFGQLADQLVPSLLAGLAQQPALPDAAQKK
jgi:ubiquinone biosynthesis protein UbiJ